MEYDRTEADDGNGSLDLSHCSLGLPHPESVVAVQAVDLNHLWTNTFEMIVQAFEELGGARTGPAWLVLAMTCQLWTEEPDLMTHMWSVLEAQPGMVLPPTQGEITQHLKEILERGQPEVS